MVVMKTGSWNFVFLVVGVPVLLSLASLRVDLTNPDYALRLLFLLAVSIVAFFATFRLIPPVSSLCLKADLGGKDINKGGTTLMYILVFFQQFSDLKVLGLFLVQFILFQLCYFNPFGEKWYSTL